MHLYAQPAQNAIRFEKGNFMQQVNFASFNPLNFVSAEQRFFKFLLKKMNISTTNMERIWIARTSNAKIACFVK